MPPERIGVRDGRKDGNSPVPSAVDKGPMPAAKSPLPPTSPSTMSHATTSRYENVAWNQPLDESDLVRIARWRSDFQPEDLAYTFLVDGETEELNLSYAELDYRAQAIAVALRKIAQPGDRALLLYEPGLDYILAFYGCLYAGIMAVPVFPPDVLRIDRTLPRLKAIMDDAKATVLMTTANAAHLAEMLEGDGQILTTDDLNYEIAADWIAPSVDADRLAYLQYTSGSTGTPKGVMVSHRNLIYNVACIDRGESQGVTGVTWLPTYHDFGLIGAVVLPMYSGRRTISMSPLAFMQRPARWLEAITRYGGTFTGAPNFSYDLCVRKIKPADRRGLDLSTLTVALNGAEPVRKETMDRFIEAFEPYGFRRDAFVACYGLAEATLGVTGGIWPQYPRVKYFQAAALEQHDAQVVDSLELNAREIVSCGPAIPDTEVAIVDPDTELRRPENAVGEIWVRGPGVAEGYWDNAGATRQTYGAFIRDTGEGPYLRTGDLGFMHEGELYVTGRCKDLVIVCGRNHYPQDIEMTTQRAHANLKPECTAAFALDIAGQERLIVVQELLRPRKSNMDEVVNAVREAITLAHEIPVYSVVLIQPGTINKTSSGKIQRRACKQAFLDGRLRVVHQWQADENSAFEFQARRMVAPRNATEARLADLYCEVLGLDEVSVHDNFFDLGGHSLLATQLVTRIRGEFLIDLPLRSLFAKPTVAELAEEIEEACEHRTIDEEHRIRPQAAGSALVPSAGQQRLWFMHQLTPEIPLFNLCIAIRVRTGLDGGVLRNAWGDIVRRHESLRTTFHEVDGTPMPRIADFEQPPLRELDLSHMDPSGREAELARISQAEASYAYDLEQGPLARMTLVRCNPNDHVLLVSMHHIISDGWSMTVLVRELLLAYQNRCEGRAMPLSDLDVQYSDYAAWQREQLGEEANNEDLQQQLAYWKDQLAGAPACLQLPTDRPRPAVPTFRGATRSVKFSAAQTKAIEEFSRKADATPYMTLLAGLQTVLGRYARQDDVCIGTALANRSRPELEGLIGFFVNTVVMRGDLSGNPTFRELVARTRETTLAAYDHPDVPFERVVEELPLDRDPRYAPLFQVALVLQNQPWQMPSEEFHLAEVHNGTSKYDLTWTLWKEGTSLCGSVEYSSDLFDDATVDRLIDAFCTLLNAATANPDSHIETLPLVNESQLEQVLFGWNQTSAPFADQSCLHELFEAQVARYADAVAVTLGDEELTYGELNSQANQLAHHLRNLGVTANTLVGISLPRSLDTIVAVLATLKAGGAYLPLDPAYPQARLALMLSDARPSVIIANSQTVAALPESEDTLVVLDRDAAAIAAADDHNLPRVAQPGSLAYVIYTSGSTGTPKGVLIEHRSACNMVQWYETCVGVTPQSRLLQFASLNFDASAGEIFPALCHGATLVMPPEEKLTPGPEFVEFLDGQRVSIAQLPPSFLALLPEAQLPHMTTLLVAGDTCSARLADRWARGRRMINGYGPTEGTVGATWSVCRPDRDPDIGRPFPNVRIYLLDQHRNPAPLGAPGEIYIGGEGVARGYLNRDELTHERFLADPFVNGGSRMYRTGDLARYRQDGTLEYLGRIDNQVKVRGFRVELPEIEAALMRQPGIKQAVVVARGQSESKRLVGYLVAEAGSDETSLATGTLLRALKAELPDYMVPAQFMVLAEFPLSPNGKVDRDALPEPDNARPDLGHSYVAPRNEVEETLAEVWAATIGVAQVGVHDNFFELGGDSLMSMQVISRARAAGLRLTPRQMFACQTIAEQAMVAVRETGILADQGPIEGDAPLGAIQHWFFENNPVDPHHFNQALMVEVQQKLDADTLRAAIEQLLRQHDALRLRFAQTEQGWRQYHVAPGAAAPLEVFDLSQLPLDEHKAAIEAQAAELQTRIDLEHGPLLRVALFNLGENQPCRLLFVIHHLAVDGVSWRMLLEDLYVAYEQLSHDQTPVLQPKTTSFRQWTQQMAELADSPEFQQQAEQWISTLAQPAASLPRDVQNEDALNTVASTQDIHVSLSTEDTQALLSEVPRALRSQINELLLTALSQAVSAWTGDRRVLCEMEGHGREDLCDDVDVSRTVGWFTSVYPVAVNTGTDLAETFGTVREHLRSIPHNGVGFGMLRYLADSEELRQRLAALPQPELTFNYLGQVDQMLSSGILRLAEETVGPTRSPRQVRRHAIEINGMVRDGQMQFDWTFSRNLHTAETIQRVAEAFAENLRGLIALARAAASDRPQLVSPGDFLEHELVAIWEEVLDVRPIGIRDEFAMLGGTTRAALRIQAEIADRYEMHVPLEVLAEAQTVEQLASILRQHAEHQGPSPLVPIRLVQSDNSQSDKAPLFLVHPAGGNVFPYYRLAHQLDAEQSVYGLEARGLKGLLAPHETVEAMAADYLQAIREVQPQGPYKLGGWSFGGLVAYEMAQQLTAAGEAVELLCLLDTRMVVDAEDGSGEGNDEAAFAALTAMFPDVEKQSLSELGAMDRETQLSHFVRHIETAGMVPAGVERDQARRMLEVFEANSQAWLSYRPQPAQVPVHLFSAVEQDSDYPVTEDLGWSGPCGKLLTVERIPGSHITMVREPHVRTLATGMNAALRNEQ